MSDAAAIVAQARQWLGTPYVHQMAVRGVGCDCLGLARGVATELGLATPTKIPVYSKDWNEIAGCETLLDGLAGYAHRREPGETDVRPGDLVCFRMRPTAIAKHVAIACGADRMIHARERYGVIEVPISAFWKARLVAIFTLNGF